MTIDSLPFGEERSPLLELRNVRKTYSTGSSVAVEAIRGVNLKVYRGEFVAIVGQSGSGKSTLLNLLGLLDAPTEGDYFVSGHNTSAMSRDDAAELRRERFGFIFQQYNLVMTLTAVENVELPAMYAGINKSERQAKALHLLKKFGLSERVAHRPSELSGGQQQRVSVARALMNGGEIILADEPTGALDSQTGLDVLRILQNMAEDGHTIILITHDRDIAKSAHRIIELHDGQVSSDNPSAKRLFRALDNQVRPARRPGVAFLNIREAWVAGARALTANPFRTILTLVGIIIGVASVIALTAIGEGTKKKVIEELSIFGTNRMYVIPGGESNQGAGGQLLERDADIIRDVPNVAATMPYLNASVVIRAGNVNYTTNGVAVTTEFPRILNWQTTSGVFFNRDDEIGLHTVAVIGTKLADRIFPDGSDPVRKMILVNNIPFTVIGVLANKGSLSGDSDDDDTIVFPFSTGSIRVFGRAALSWVSVLIDDIKMSDATADAITAKLEAAHHLRDFRVFNKAATIEASNRTQNALTLMLGFTAAISLLVGGIGVMNVMLMTVTERTREIGIRMATGARSADILRQFVFESVIVSSIGGFIGVVLGLVATLTLKWFGSPIVVSWPPAAIAWFAAIGVGLIFGAMPARRASMLNPIDALARE